MVFANTSMMGVDTGGPDVCLTPAPPAPAPVPIPYPNIGAGPTGITPIVNILWSVGPAHNMATTQPMSNGDNVGVSMGVASGTVMGPVRHVVGAVTFLICGLPATRLTSPAIHNSTNAPGIRSVPSQIRVVLACG